MYLGDSEMYWVLGGGTSTSVDESGCWINFANSRGGNETTCNEFIEKSVLPFMDSVIAKYPPTDGQHVLSYCDGENTVLQALMSPRILELYNNRKYISAKSSASISGKGQAQDVGPLHRLLMLIYCLLIYN